MGRSGKLPQHIAIIMDGNGRWARERGLPRVEGHRRGVESIREVVRAARELGIRYLTLYAFSKENWGRPKREVDFLMSLLSSYLDSELKELASNDIRFHVIGCRDDLPARVRAKIERNMAETRTHKSLVLTLALSYSSRVEILDAVRQLCRRVQACELAAEDISAEEFSKALYTSGMPDPDLLIRTSGELRVSNFLLWQISYTELYVSEKNWPDFRKADLVDAIREFQKRERRFGKTKPAEGTSRQGLTSKVLP